MTERDAWELVDFARWCFGAAPEGAPMPPLPYPVTETCQAANDAPTRRTVCDAYVSDGNEGDPSFAYCVLPHAHAGAHEYRA